LEAFPVADVGVRRPSAGASGGAAAFDGVRGRLEATCVIESAATGKLPTAAEAEGTIEAAAAACSMASAVGGMGGTGASEPSGSSGMATSAGSNTAKSKLVGRQPVLDSRKVAQ
jgi:hypothetical protein